MTSLTTVTVIILLSSVTHTVSSLGSATTIAVTYGSTITICGIIAGQPSQRIQCWRNGQLFNLYSNVSFDSISGGRNLLCGVISGGSSLICWNPSDLIPKRLYHNKTISLNQLVVGDSQICAVTNSTAFNLICWRDGENNVISHLYQNQHIKSLSSGFGVSCAVNSTNGVLCFGANLKQANAIEQEFDSIVMMNVFVGGGHACGVNSTGFVICRGENHHGKIDVPDHQAFEFSTFALGLNHTCGLRRVNKTVVCWGGGGGDMSMTSNNLSGYAVGLELGLGLVSFESIVAGSDFTCGLTSNNLSVICWGEGWVRNGLNGSISLGFELRLGPILPGPCVKSGCDQCGIYTQSDTLCSGSGSICMPCDITSLVLPVSPFSPPTNVPQSSSPSRPLRRGLLAFAIVGSIGTFAGICTVIYCLWTGICCGNKKIHNSVQPTITTNTQNAPPLSNSSSASRSVSRSSTIRRQASRVFRRQRSGTSSKHTDRDEEFTFADLALATDNFSDKNKIGAGSFGVVYKGKLLDGREVAIKRGETSQKAKKFEEKESAFDSELAFLSRLHHKHLVRLVGYCEEREEKLLVYEYMKNGALYDHLHVKKNEDNDNDNDNDSNVLNSWKMRIKIALDAARGIEYLHNYAVPPIIHRDIKSSNILLDANWVARVSDFGLSLMGHESDSEHRQMKAAGTVGYIDPEYYGLNVVTAKSDVYGLGVVMLELLTGKRAIFKSNNNNDNGNGTGTGTGGVPISLVDYVVPTIISGELAKVLDKRVRPPEVNEADAVELMAYTAIHCVNLEGRDRPTMSDIVANLGRALSLCDGSHASISSGQISIISE